MKVVYISPHQDGTGYSHSAIEYILALNSVGIDVVPRSVKMTPTQGDVPTYIKMLEGDDTNNVDAVIQYNLPNTFSYKSGVKNIGMFAYETNTIAYTGWEQHLSLMDKIIVLNKSQKNSLKYKESLYSKCRVIPCPVKQGTALLRNGLRNISPFPIPENYHKFYSIGEFNSRKNWGVLLLSYLSTFSSDDQVALIIKTNNSSGIRKLIDDIKDKSKRFAIKEKYPKIIVIDGYMSEAEISDLHLRCDTFITASRGEAWCLPCTDALAVGNMVIAPNHTAFKDYLAGNNSTIRIKSTDSIVLSDGGLPNLYTSNELWGNINTNDLKQAMLNVYQNQDKWFSNNLRFQRQGLIKNFTHEKVGQMLKSEILDDN